jgi:hypothetical protein
MLTRYALLGDAAFILVDLPRTGTAGTSLELPCLTDHHGIVTKGTFSVHHEDGRTDTFEEGDAFYVPPGPPAHWFSSSPLCVVGGFAPLTEQPDVSPEALAALGLTVVARPSAPTPPPTDVTLAGAVAPFHRSGAIDVEGSWMGRWLFMRSRMGPRSGFTAGWCDLPHWGLVLDGEIAITYPERSELAARGDVYFSPPGHRLTSADGATIVDYTPISELGATRISAWRRSVIDRATHVEGVPAVAIELKAEAAGQPVNRGRRLLHRPPEAEASMNDARRAGRRAHLARSLEPWPAGGRPVRTASPSDRRRTARARTR